MKNTLLLFIFLFTQIAFGQKGFKKVEIEVDLEDHFYYYTPKQKLTIYKNKPKQLNFRGMVYFNPADYLPIGEKHARGIIPATRYYFQKSDLRPHKTVIRNGREICTKEYYEERNLVLEEDIIDGVFHKYQLPREKLEGLFYPFFFKKHEVTNTEYWEFLESVGETIDSSIYYKDLIYSYKQNGQLIHVPIYPDTSCWEKDKANHYYLSKDYFTRPITSEYPVIGINYHQAKAFCHWKTKHLQQLLGKNSKQFKLKVDLPSELEWEWMAISNNTKEDRVLTYSSMDDNDWMTDLSLVHNYQEMKFKHHLLKSVYPQRDGFHGASYLHNANLEDKELQKSWIKSKKKFPKSRNHMDNLDRNNISGMADNVSEWLRDTYKENWQLMFQRQLKLWEQENTPESLLLHQIALYHNSHVDKDGHLVKGGNWIDNRYSNSNGKNKEGIHAKTFLSPTKSHSTLGFRYVVYFIE